MSADRYGLGLGVRISDYLARVDLARPSALPERIPGLTKDERDLIQRKGDPRLWVPASTVTPESGLIHVDRHAPAAGRYAGVVVRKVTIHQGVSVWLGEGEGTTWATRGTLNVYAIAYHLHRKPLYVTADMITETGMF